MEVFLQFFCKHWKCEQYMSTMSTWTAIGRKQLLLPRLQRQIIVTDG